MEKNKKKSFFLKGPIPLCWLTPCSQLGGKALNVGLAIWFLAYLTKSSKVKLTHRTIEKFGLNRHSSYRGLARIEKAGLVSVVRKTGNCPNITLLNVPDRIKQNFYKG